MQYAVRKDEALTGWAETALPLRSRRDSTLHVVDSPASTPADAFTKAVLDNLADAVAVNVGLTRVYVNDAYLQLYGLADKSEAVGHSIDEHLAPEQKRNLRERALKRQKGELPPDSFVYKINRKDGTELMVEARGIGVVYDGQPASLAILRDVTERHKAEADLRAALSLNNATLESTADGILVVDSKARIVSFNAKFSRMWGLDASGVRVGDDATTLANLRDLKSANAFMSSLDRLRINPRDDTLDVLEFKDGRVFERYSTPHKIGDVVIGRVWSFRDITARVQLERELRRQIDRDPLTDLLNRRGFIELIGRALTKAKRGHRAGSMLLVDLDDFKDVNDSLGHKAGDEVLVGLAALLSREIGTSGTVARLGGDEFAVLLPDTTEVRAATIERELLSALREHTFTLSSGETVDITASLGVVRFPKDGSTVEELMSRVDLALYDAKAHGRNQARAFAPLGKLESDAEARLKLRHLVRRGLKEDGYRLYGQPIQDMRTGEVHLHELLLRLKDQTGKILPAASFIDLAERSGLILPIDRWVVQQAIDFLRSPAMAASGDTLAVNLSSKAFADKGLYLRIEQSLRGRPEDARRLVFEVTETAAITNIDSAEKFMRGLKRLGCRFALDDFGVGFSSLQRLRRLPVDFIKIDGSFIRALERSEEDRALVSSIVGIAQALHMQTVAEFVERPQQLEILRDLGVDYAQGYLIGRPRSLAGMRYGRPGRRAA